MLCTSELISRYSVISVRFVSTIIDKSIMIMNKEEERAGAALDDELTESLRMWDLVDADEALAEHDWESVSRINCFNDNKCW